MRRYSKDGRQRGRRGELVITENSPPSVDRICWYSNDVSQPVALEWVTEPARIGEVDNAFVIDHNWPGWRDSGFWVEWTFTHTTPDAWTLTNPWPVHPDYVDRYLDPMTGEEVGQ